MGRSWTPTLIYSTEHEYPNLRVATNVGLSSSVSIDYVRVKVFWATPGDTITRDVVLPNDGQARRVVMESSAAGGPGLRHYTVTADAYYFGAIVASASDTGSVLVVNRVDASNQQFGSGWWLSGVESMLSGGYGLASNEKMWIGGDGSARIYTQVGSSDVWTVSPTVDRPDTLLRVVSGGVTTWQRRIPDGGYVEFDNAGRHVSTVNRQGLRTRITYSASGGRLDSLVLPMPAGVSLKRAYTFEYLSDSTMLGFAVQTRRLRVRVTAPATNGVARITYLNVANWTTSGGWTGGLTSVTDPAGDTTKFNHGSAYIDRLGHGESYSVLSDGLLRYAAYSNSAGTSTLYTNYCAVDRSSLGCDGTCGSLYMRTGCSGWETPANVRMVVDGPRTDIDDTVRFGVNQFGAPTLIRDPLGNQTTIAYGDSRFPLLVTSTTNAASVVQQQAYNSRALVDSSVIVNPLGDSRNAITKYTWHSSKPLLTQRRDPTGGLAEFSYDSVGNRIWQQVGGNSSTRVNYAYDSQNRLEYVQAPGHSSSQREHIQYDALLGNVQRVTSPIGFYTEYTTDSIGRVTQTAAPYDSAGSTHVTTYTYYDQRDRVVKHSTAAANTSYSFATISGTSSASTALSDTIYYDKEGRTLGRGQIKSTFPGVTYFSSVSSSYDAMGRVVSRSSPGGSSTFSYDDAGNLTVTTGVTMQYDVLGRLTQRITTGTSQGAACHPMITAYGDPCGDSDLPFPMYAVPTYVGTFTVPTDTATFTYDAVGNMLTANNIDGRISRTYYPNGQLKTDTLRIRTYTRTSNANTDFSTHAYGLKYEYDLSGRRTKLYHPSSLAYGCGSSCYQSYAYDTLTSALTGITSTRGHSFSFTYTNGGGLATTSGPGGTYQSFTYDLDGRLAERLERRGLGTVDTVHHDFLSRDAAGRVIRDTTTGIASLTQVTRNAYNTFGNLVASEYTQLSPLKTLTEEWTLDPLGNPTNYYKNRLQTGATSSSNTYATTTSQLTSTSSTSYTYDSQGRQDQTGGSNNYTWSWYAGNGTVYGFQRQGSNSAPATRSVLEEYRYDALGRRILVRSRPDTSCTAAYCKAAIERYVWDGNQKLYEIRVAGGTSLSSSALEVDTATGPFFGKIGYVMGSQIDAPLALDRDGLVVMPHVNWRGLYDAGTDTTGTACCATIDWTGKDQTAYLNAPQPTTPTGWAGSLVIGQLDQSGLMYAQNRYYDPSTGRFTQSDPIGLGGGLNQYGFAGSDPVNLSDPLGLALECQKGYHVETDWDTGEDYCAKGGGVLLGPVVVTADPNNNDPGIMGAVRTPLTGEPNTWQWFDDTFRSWNGSGWPRDVDFHEAHPLEGGGMESFPHAHDYVRGENGKVARKYRELEDGELLSVFLKQLLDYASRLGNGSMGWVFINPNRCARHPLLCA